jgi:hypothetical protein
LVAGERRMASAAARSSPETTVRVAGFDGDVGAGADREAEVSPRERGGVVDAVADHRHDPAVGLEALDDVSLVGGHFERGSLDEAAQVLGHVDAEIVAANRPSQTREDASLMKSQRQGDRRLSLASTRLMNSALTSV